MFVQNRQQTALSVCHLLSRVQVKKETHGSWVSAPMLFVTDSTSATTSKSNVCSIGLPFATWTAMKITTKYFAYCLSFVAARVPTILQTAVIILLNDATVALKTLKQAKSSKLKQFGLARTKKNIYINHMILKTQHATLCHWSKSTESTGSPFLGY